MKDKSYLNKAVPSNKVISLMNKYWNATNYLSAIQLYLLDNPLLRKPLKQKDLKQRIVGPWGTAPGQNFVYVHLNRAIQRHNLDMLLLSGPGHGGIFWTANTYLDGSFSKFYPDVSQDEKGLKKFCKQFCFPYGVSSHIAPEMPGSIHEGGELGYVLSHAFGAVFDNPNLIATAIVGDGEAETGPLATSWHCNKFLNPITDGAVLPILHLNGYKVFNPTVLARISHEELESLFKGYGWKPYFVEGTAPMEMHKKMAQTLEIVVKEIKQIQKNARDNGDATRPVWPMIVLRTPKGWTCPKEVDGLVCEDSHNAYHAPYSMEKPEHIALLENWLKSYHPEELFDENGTLVKELQELAPQGDKRLGCCPNANGGAFLDDLFMPDPEMYAVHFEKPGEKLAQDTTVLSGFMQGIMVQNPHNFRIFCPDEMVSNRMNDVYKSTNNVLNANIYESDESIARSGRVLDAYLSEHTCEGWCEGYILTGRHGTFVTYAAFARVVDSMISQHSKWLKMAGEVSWRKPVSSLNLILTSHLWQQDHNGYSHQDPGLVDHLANKKESMVNFYFPPDANCLLNCYEKCMTSKMNINIITTSKKPSLQWLTYKEAKAHCEKGVGIWGFASNDNGNPDVVVVGIGDTINMEALGAVKILRANLPKLKIRFINVVELMKLMSPERSKKGLTDKEFDEMFTVDKPIVVNYHGYPSLIQEFLWNRHNKNISVHGYNEEGRISTPFDMKVQNEVDRFNVVLDILSKIKQTPKVKELQENMLSMLDKQTKYIKKYGIDLPEIRDWKWEE